MQVRIQLNLTMEGLNFGARASRLKFEAHDVNVKLNALSSVIVR